MLPQRGASKGGKYIEAMARVKAIALDKPEPSLMDPQTFLMFSPKRNQPPRTASLYCRNWTSLNIPWRKPSLQAEPKDLNHTKQKALHHGKRSTACLVCENETVFVGKLHQRKSRSKGGWKDCWTISFQGKTSVVVSFGTGVAGIIGLTDTIKHDSISVATINLISN
jgi:Cd2+/Zn2+-exporting ATPase